MPENQISKAECKKRQRIRARASYVLFRELYDFLKENPSVTDILRKFHDILDERRSFGSIRNAECAEESLSLVLKDNGEMDEEGARIQVTDKSWGDINMAKKKQSAALLVKDAMFFPEDFRKLHRDHVIYIKQDVIIDLDKL